MPRFPKEPLFDQATLKRIEEEALLGNDAGIDVSDVGPLDPKTDPFGMNFEWLGPPGEFVTYATSYPEMHSRSKADIFRIAAAAVRRTALAGSLAGETDDRVFQKWLGEGFIGLCHEAGPSGIELLANIRSDRELLPVRVEAIRSVFRETLPASSFREDEEIALATASILSLMITD